MTQSNADIFASILDEEFFSEIKPAENKNVNIDEQLAKDETIVNKAKLNYDVDIFSSEFCNDFKEINENATSSKSVIHTNDTDSSDDEENKYFENVKYNSFGKEVKDILKREVHEEEEEKSSKSSWKKQQSKNKDLVKQICLAEKPVTKTFDVYSDPVFGIRIINPLISSKGLQMRMEGKIPVSLSRLKIHINQKSDSDWVIAGVIVKTLTKTSQSGSQFMIWYISDLKIDSLTVPIFLFGRTYKSLWKTNIGSVVGILNPSVSNKKDKKNDDLSLTISNSDQVMLWGTSKDFGYCKAMKKNGEKCTSFVNKSQCGFCIYHVKKEYQKFSFKRTELQSPIGGNNNYLRNKVLGNNEVFYGGKSYTSIKAPNSVKKVNTKDKNRLSQLGITVLENVKKKNDTPAVPLQFSRGMAVLNSLSPNNQVSISQKFLGKDLNKSITKCDLQNKLSPSLNVKTSTLESDLKPCKLLKEGNAECSPDKISEKNVEQISHKRNKQITLKEKPMVSKNLGTKSKTELSVEKSKSYITVKGKLLNEETGRNTLENTISPILSNPVFDIKQKRLVTDNLKKGPCLSNPELTIIKKDVTKADAKGEMKKSCSSIIKPEYGQVGKTKIAHNETNALQKRFNSLFDIIPKKAEKVTITIPEISKDPIQINGTISTGTISKAVSPNLTKKISRAKANALKIIKEQGISLGESNKKKSVKREREEEVETEEPIFSELFLELMKKTSCRIDLVEAESLRMEEEYFDKMEMKESLEEKMLNTFKIDCKAVRCGKCKYIWFSAAEMCKSECHPLKVVDAVKRFFKCGDCGTRTVSLHKLPLINCKQCQSSNWLRAPMIREKVTTKNVNELSIRGGEQKFANSSITNASLDLLVPE